MSKSSGEYNLPQAYFCVKKLSYLIPFMTSQEEWGKSFYLKTFHQILFGRCFSIDQGHDSILKRSVPII